MLLGGNLAASYTRPIATGAYPDAAAVGETGNDTTGGQVPATYKGSSVRMRLLDLLDTLPVGERLAGERDLAARLGVARMTLRRAVDLLVEEGRLERRHGSGTYVVRRPFARALGLTSFTEDMRSRGLVPGNQLLNMDRLKASVGLAHRLRIPVGEEIIRFTRLRLGDEEPIAVETTWMPATYVPGLSADDLDGSLYELLADRYRIWTASAHSTIEPILPDPRTAAVLEIPHDQPCLLIRMVDLDQRRRTIMAAECIYRGDRYQLHVDLSANAFHDEAARRSR